MYALIRQWEASGLSQPEFLNQKGISKSTFGYWRKKYLREPGNIKRKDNFIPVKIDQAGSTKVNQEIIELFYPNGIRLVCSSGMELSRLKPLIVL